jgi:hypothetical protein
MRINALLGSNVNGIGLGVGRFRGEEYNQGGFFKTAYLQKKKVLSQIVLSGKVLNKLFLYILLLS